MALLIFFAVIAWNGNNLRTFFAALSRGGWWMIGLALSLALIAVVGILLNPDIFWAFFSGFHALFFEGDSWLFYYSDTLIRLFPIRFWQDAVIAIASIALGGGLGLALGLKKYIA
jgi:uncharacterized membrane protein